MGRPCTHESLGGKQGKHGGLVVKTLGAKYGNRGHVKRALRIGVTEGSRHVYPGKLNRPPLPSGNSGGAGCEISGWNVGGRAPDVRYPGGMSADRHQM